MRSKADASAAPAAATTRAATQRPPIRWSDFVVHLFFALTIGDMGSLTTANVFNFPRTASMIAAGEFDLSIGSTATLSALVTTLVVQAGFGIGGGMAAATLAAGALRCRLGGGPCRHRHRDPRRHLALRRQGHDHRPLGGRTSPARSTTA